MISLSFSSRIVRLGGDYPNGRSLDSGDVEGKLTVYAAFTVPSGGLR